MFKVARILRNGMAEKESERRQKLSILDYKELAKEIPFDPIERVIDNNLYGYAYHLKKYAGIKHDLKGYLEHGLFWGGIVHNDQRNWHFKRIITLSQMRKKEIESQLPQKNAIPVGPYIHYAADLMSKEERQALKNKLGRVLLAFPVHSIKGVKNNYDKQRFIEEINRIKGDFDTVLISLYYLDVNFPDRYKPYLDEGFEIVTSGHRYDLNFVSRQKEIIGLADVTISNSVGTHTGYCVYMNKPHYIFHQEYRKTAKSDKEKKRVEAVVANKHKELMAKQKAEILEPFTIYIPDKLTKEQINIVSKYWGFEDVKTPEELRALFK